MPDLQSALYFSAVTYTTTGYGDLVLPKEWRLVGGVEAITGILMCHRILFRSRQPNVLDAMETGAGMSA